MRRLKISTLPETGEKAAALLQSEEPPRATLSLTEGGEDRRGQLGRDATLLPVAVLTTVPFSGAGGAETKHHQTYFQVRSHFLKIHSFHFSKYGPCFSFQQRYASCFLSPQHENNFYA